jgi:peroxiredoxin
LKKLMIVMIAVTLISAFTAPGIVVAQAVVGQAAPNFTATDIAGKSVSLMDIKGKYAVLEWFNPDCPFVRKHYNSRNMPAVQKYAAGKGVTWLLLTTADPDSSTPKALAELAAWGKSASPADTLRDLNGKVGRAYGVRTTPHMYLIDPQGKLIYAGAIDSKPSANPADIRMATNYVVQAIDEALAGKPISKPITQPYGCSVKYSAASSA